MVVLGCYPKKDFIMVGLLIEGDYIYLEGFQILCWMWNLGADSNYSLDYPLRASDPPLVVGPPKRMPIMAPILPILPTF